MKAKPNNMERTEVYRRLDNERQYQDTIRKENERETRNDNEKSVAEFILYMENKLNEAKDRIYNLNQECALDSLRKVTALGIAAGEAFGFPERNTGFPNKELKNK